MGILQVCRQASSWGGRRYSPEEIAKEVAHMRDEMEKEGLAVAAKADNKCATACA